MFFYFFLCTWFLLDYLLLTNTYLQFLRHPHILTIKTAIIKVGKFDGEMVSLKLSN